MSYYKTTSQLDSVRVHGDCSVIGSEFVNFLSSVLTMRLSSLLKTVKEVKDMTQPDGLRMLQRAKRVRAGESGWQLVKLNEKETRVLQEQGLLPKPEPVKRGRKPRKKTEEKLEAERNKPKRGRGRPRKKQAAS